MLFDWIVIGIIATVGFAFWWEYWPRSLRSQHQRGYQRWSDDAKARGLSAAQMMDDYQFRHAMVRLRRRASDAAIAWPGGYELRIAEIASEEATTLAAYDKKVARKFLDVVNSSRLSDILYDDAMGAVLAAPSPIAYQPTADDFATLATIR